MWILGAASDATVGRMARRVVYGNAFSENRWPMVDEGSCAWVTVPGTDVRLEIQQGQPLAILRAFAADYNAFVEPLRDADSACWTPTNSVGTSNHLSGSGCDFNWSGHPFRVRGTFRDDQMATIRELLEFYEDTIFWGGDWDNPIDEMHWQLGYETYGNPATQSFIDRKIRSDGFSTFRRGETTAGHMLTTAERYALAVIRVGQALGVSPKGIKIALTVPFVESGWRMYANANIPESLALPHDDVGSDHDSTGLFQQRQAWGPLSCTMDAECSARLFYLGGEDGQRGLTDFPYDTDARTPGGWAQAVQVSAFPDRYDEHWDEAVELYDRLIGTASTEGGFLMALSDAEQRELLDLARQQSGYRRISRSPLRMPGERETETISGFEWNTDGNVHVLLVYLLARLGDPNELARLNAVARTTEPGREHDALLAQAILNSLTGNVSDGGVAVATPVPTGAIVVDPVPAAPPSPAPRPYTPPAAPQTPALPAVVQTPTGEGVGGAVAALGAEIATLKNTLDSYANALRS